MELPCASKVETAQPLSSAVSPGGRREAHQQGFGLPGERFGVLELTP